MGTIQEFRCPSCRKTWKIFAGHGMIHSTLRRVLEAFPANTKKEVLKDVSNGQEPLFHFSYYPAACQQCHNIVSVPVLCFPENGRSYISGCPECGSIVKPLEEGGEFVCPQCQAKNLSCKETGHWD